MSRIFNVIKMSKKIKLFHLVERGQLEREEAWKARKSELGDAKDTKTLLELGKWTDS